MNSQTTSAANTDSASMQIAPLSLAEKTRLFEAIYADAHTDFKCHLKDGSKSILGWAKYGFGLQTLETISDVELRERFASLRRRQLKR